MLSNALVTAGGTIESIDDVRLFEMHDIEAGDGNVILSHAEIKNISNGKLGKTIAKELATRGVRTKLLIRKDLVGADCPESEMLQIVNFRSVKDLDAALRAELGSFPADIVYMAAAVSDYSPVKFEGKMSSSPDEISIKLRKNPKLLDSLRELAGDKAILLGFKLLSGVSTESLIDAAVKQNQRAALNFTVANDLQKIDFKRGHHPVELVAADGSTVSFSGTVQETAGFLVSTFVK